MINKITVEHKQDGFETCLKDHVAATKRTLGIPSKDNIIDITIDKVLEDGTIVITSVSTRSDSLEQDEKDEQ